jgi:hypothetical protein
MAGIHRVDASWRGEWSVTGFEAIQFGIARTKTAAIVCVFAPQEHAERAFPAKTQPLICDAGQFTPANGSRYSVASA